MTREIVVTGASGWIGGYAATALQERGWSVTGVSRTPDQARDRRPDLAWIGTGTELDETVTRIGAVLNLCGRHPFEQPWTTDYVGQMRSSRIDTTRRIAAALARSAAPDPLLVSGSGYPVYGDAGERSLPDDAPVSRGLVSGAMDADWEDAAAPAGETGARLVLLRIGLTLGNDGGAFPVLRQPFDAGAGIVLGSGRQWLPWIHREDTIRLITEIVENSAYRGPVNLVSPEAVRYADFAGALAQRMEIPCDTVVPAEAVAAQLGGAAELLLSSIRMVPRKAADAGFAFVHPTLADAVEDLVQPSVAVA